MSRVRVVTDSTADLLPEWRQELGIEMVPLTVHFGDEQYLDQVELHPEAFFARLRQTVPGGAESLPRTSQPPPAAFAQVYRRIAAAGCEVVSIHISQELSGTLAAARAAAAEVPEAAVRVVDSRLASIALGLCVLRAARAAAAGLHADGVAEEARRAASAVRCAVALDTLRYLALGGRIGRARAWLGALLDVKPLITLEDGVVAPLSRVRGRRHVVGELVRVFEEQVPGSEVEVLVAHGDDPEGAERLAAALRATGRVAALRVGWIGPVIGSHVGPGVLGFAACPLTGGAGDP